MADLDTLPEPLRLAVLELAIAARGGREHPKAVADFIAATEGLPAAQCGQIERNIRSTAGTLWMRPKTWPWGGPRIPRRVIIPWYDLVSYDGYRREGALRAIDTAVPTPLIFALLVRRLNDWVPQVRAAARDACRVAFEKTDAAIIVEMAWGVLPLRPSWGRLGSLESDLIDTLSDRADVANTLAQKLMTRRTGPAAEVLRQASRRPGLDSYLPDLVHHAVQPAVRAVALRMLLQRKAVWRAGQQWKWIEKPLGVGRFVTRLASRPIDLEVDVLSLLKSAVHDRSPFVRRAAGDELVQRRYALGASAYDLARVLIKDAYPSVVERGEFVLRDAPDRPA